MGKKAQKKETSKTVSKNPLIPIASRVYHPLIICILGIIIYSNSFDCSFHFDDIGNIVQNRNIHDISNLKAIWNFVGRRFLGNITFALNYHFSQVDVFGYHLINLLIHLCTSVFAWWLTLLILLTPAIQRGKIIKHKKFIAIAVGLLFVSHPVQTQSVTYIVQRLSSLATLFYLASLALYLKGRLVKGNTVKSAVFFAGSAVTALMGMLIKEIAFTLPFAIILFETGFMHTGKIKEIFKKRMLLLYMILPLFFTLFIPGLLLLKYKAGTITKIFGTIPSQRPGDPLLSGGIYLITQFRVIVTYIRLLFVPINQNIDYDFPASQSFFDLPTLLSFLFLVSILIFAIWIFPRRRLVSIGILWFFLTLSVESSIKPIRNVIFEHRLYLPMFGFSLFFVCSLYNLFREKYLKALIPLFILIICITSFLTYERNKVWKDDISLWSDVIKKSPDKARGYFNLGSELHQRGKIEEAINLYKQAIRRNPDYVLAYNNLGVLLVRQGKIDEAVLLFKKALTIDPADARAYNNLGDALSRQGKTDEAIEHFRKAVRLAYDFVQAYNNLGTLLLGQGKTDEAISAFQTAVRYAPDYIDAYNNLARAYLSQGNYDKALENLKYALEYDKDSEQAYLTMGNILIQQGENEEALIQLQNALRINPDNIDTHIKLSTVYQSLGNTGEAKAHRDEAFRILRKVTGNIKKNDVR